MQRSCTSMHNHTGTHLDTFAHIYREDSLFNNAPPPRPDGTVHGDAASVKAIVGRDILLDVAKYRGGLALAPFTVSALQPLLLVGVTLLGGCAGLLPAVLAYRTEVAENLVPLS